MALPRELSLQKENDQWILMQQPVHSLEKLRMDERVWKLFSVTGTKKLPVSSQQFELETTITVSHKGKSGIKLAVGKENSFVIGYNASTGKLYIDRSGCNNNGFHENFRPLSYYETPLALINGRVNLRVFFDKSIVEVYANDGSAVMTAQLFPAESENGIELFSEGGMGEFSNTRIWNMKSAW